MFLAKDYKAFFLFYFILFEIDKAFLEQSYFMSFVYVYENVSQTY